MVLNTGMPKLRSFLPILSRLDFKSLACQLKLSQI